MGEQELVRTNPGSLDDVLRHERGLIMKREIARDFRWGFFGGPLARQRQFIYKHIVHPLLKKR